MSEHLDLDALADVVAGLAEPEHLTGCAACRTRLAELRTALPGVSALLAALPDPVPPADLEQRLLAVVQQERASVVPLARRSRRRLLPVLGGLAAAAAAVVVVALVQPGGHGTSSTSASKTSYTVNNTGTDYTTATQVAAALPGLLAGQSARRAVGAPSSAGSGGSTTSLAGPPSDTGKVAAPQAAPEAADPLAALRTTAGLATCLASLTDPSQPGLPLALDYASFKGQPALVVVLPSSAAGKVDVFVVPDGCAHADGQLLLFTRVTKPA